MNPQGRVNPAAPAPPRSGAGAHAKESFLGKLSVDLQAQIGLEHEVTLQVAVMKAAGWSKKEIIEELGIALVVYEMCEYRLRAITREWTHGAL